MEGYIFALLNKMIEEDEADYEILTLCLAWSLRGVHASRIPEVIDLLPRIINSFAAQPPTPLNASVAVA